MSLIADVEKLYIKGFSGVFFWGGVKMNPVNNIVEINETSIIDVYIMPLRKFNYNSKQYTKP